MYHINNEGKILPCNAKVRACPYGNGNHASTKEELYYTLMKFQGSGEVYDGAEMEIQMFGRMQSLMGMSYYLMDSDSPVSDIIATLDWAIKKTEESDPDAVGEKWDTFIKSSSERVYDALDWGYQVPSFVPTDIKDEAYRLFYERNKGIYTEKAMVTRNTYGFKAIRRLDDMKDVFQDYVKFKQRKLTHSNKEASLNWMKKDFYQFSHDMNTSKLLTQPIFYGNVDEAKKQIKEMDDSELLSAHDDYLITDEEIHENVRLANYFNYSFREDMVGPGNQKLSEWYRRNQKIYKSWEKNSAKRVFISMELAKELDSRGLMRQDSSSKVGRGD